LTPVLESGERPHRRPGPREIGRGPSGSIQTFDCCDTDQSI
jgi:hypothetical protein